jgi:hypothetical protein
MPDIYFPVNQFALTDQAIDTRVMLVPDVFTRTFASTDRWPQDVMMVGKQRPFPPPQDELKWRKLPDVFSRVSITTSSPKVQSVTAHDGTFRITMSELDPKVPR